ncbi:YihY/virulence factor BrkB family protein [Lacticaseibacillus parakribbianus]|uniref:YihY/virulence factor BrkB family protein n=1 Tax=Lacticaseibacillus parakribbianus TaxID=2970927 RepID=UPI003B84B34E
MTKESDALRLVRPTKPVKAVPVGDRASLPLAAQKLSAKAKAKAVLRLIIQRVFAAELGPTSASLAYYTLLSLFPMLITLGNLLPVFGLNYDGVSSYLAQVIPEDIMAFINPVIHNLLVSTSGGVLSIGAVATLWAASLGVDGLKNGFNKAYGVTPPQNFLIQRLLSMGLFIILIVALGAVMVAFTFGRQFLEWLVPLLGLSDAWLETFNTWRWPVTLVALVVVISSIDYFLPNAKIKFRTIIPGTIFTIVAWLALSQLFAIYMRYFGTRFNSYGTIGTFMVLLLWLNFSAMMWLFGAVINAVVAEYYTGRLHHSRGKVRDFVKRRRAHVAP